MGQPQPIDDDTRERELADLQRQFMRGELTAMQYEKAKWQIEGTYPEKVAPFIGPSDAARAVVSSGLPGTEPIRDTNDEWIGGSRSPATASRGETTAGGTAVGATAGVGIAAAICLVLAAIAFIKLGILGGLIVSLVLGFVGPVIAIIAAAVGGTGGAIFGATEGQHPAVRLAGAGVGVVVAALVVRAVMG